ncbi:MAG: hypothetical protein CO113_17030 [Elusimicrobia bacterium CG_4_9_14_3_um_filter_62_55]|nr:MAG: hypothetical protein COR54_15240 [Elusimicrobia bacterium CG22_combo_CG10-13_8_21_14_all_63_91]PJA13918.1 MAG: hypothetical protein COX66_13865 [Elusimicrobia bacterium CG_4_10_14_0_2_um_filter_63_34]PJB23817.1 MAG: hypothetical protein CO113_17030 [Elusimicrobia bacterium CG_4_9_14_3_um_filter_62_55]
MHKALGVFRELTNSPNRETDDALILEAVMEQLSNLGIEAKTVTPEELDGMELGDCDVILPMCESYPRITRLAEEARTPGRFWINPPRSVLNCYRTHMVPAMLRLADVTFPDSEIRAVADGAGDPPSFAAPAGWWLKRGDVHNTCDHDVVFVKSWSQVEDVLADFTKREVTHFVVQPHIDGDLVKFYGAGPDHWFTWFYHDPVRAKRLPFELDALAAQAAAGARELDLEVFGGDAIISENGRITLLDLNSWPSFALVRREAAVQIAWHLQRRLNAARRVAS